VVATAGSATLSGTASVDVSSAGAVNLTAPYINMTVVTPNAGWVLTDGCIDALTGAPFFVGGTFGVPQVQIS